MADKIVKGIQTTDGVARIDYTALANLPEIDSELSATSTNAIQNKVVHTEFTGVKKDIADLKDNFNEAGHALDSVKLSGKDVDYFATAESVKKIEDELGLNSEQPEGEIGGIKGRIEDLEDNFNEDGQALDSAMLGGKEPSYYAVKEEVMPIAGGKFTGAVTFWVDGKEVWLSFTDEDNNETDEPYIHWFVEKEEE